MMLCGLCQGITPTTNQYHHHTSFTNLSLSAVTCSLCQLIANVLEKSGDRKRAEEYRETINKEHRLVNDTSITISVNCHDLPKEDTDRRAPYQLVVTCGPLKRQRFLNTEEYDQAPVTVLGIYAEKGLKNIAHFYSIVLIVTTGSIAAEQIATRPVPASCDTDEAIQLIIEWVSNCAQNHDDCQVGYVDGKNRVSGQSITEMTEQLKVLCNGEDLPLPARVLDLQAGRDRHGIALLETQRVRGTYAALSHCWGRSQHLTTTKLSLQERLEHISFDDLSRTFQDAITITRKLGMQYLWIDSLCIIQDDLEDWETESGLMGEIYRNAHITIAAAHSVDGDGGCFHTRTPSAVNAIEMKLPLAEGSWYIHARRGSYQESVWNGPLQQRAWTLQERCLSRRIIHFAGDQIYFECNKALQYEDQRPEQEHTTEYLSFSTLYFTAMNKNPLYQLLMGRFLVSQWTVIVESFTTRGLTKAEDALPALSGIATHLSTVCKIDYAAGLWLGNILTDMLLWRVKPYEDGRQNSRPAEYRAPSWSWASMQGPVLFARTGAQPLEDGHSSDELDIARADVSVEPVGIDPNGRVRTGKLKARGWLVPVRNLGTLKKKDFDNSDYGHWASWMARLELSKKPHIIMTGYNYVKSMDGGFWGAAAFDDEQVLGQSNVFALLVMQKGKTGELQQVTSGSDEHLASFLVLYLTLVATSDTEYHRIGMGHLLQLRSVELGEKQIVAIV